VSELAAKKWPKWVIGLSSVVSFTGFLYLLQYDKDSLNDGNKARNFDDLTITSPLNQLSYNNKPVDTSGAGVAVFVHSRSEFQTIEELSPTAKAEREQLLEKLNWTQPLVQVPPPNSAITKAPLSQPSANPGIVKSDRKTRRS
jgi:hypothetical protein